ncbi:MAG: efflux RND transporter periplasmic adaptor subunit [Bacteroidetes bacterium]|nr:efflux RND transporter periplasmic adaptor subunit [Bacteroidota bacterium]
MKKIMKYLLIVLIIVGVIYATYFFITSNNTSAIVYKTETAFKTTIEKKTIATGKVVPEDEVEIKPQISGIIESILVKEGQLIKAGDLIAKIKVVPNEAALSSALGRVKNANYVFENSKLDLDRNKILYDKQVISTQDFNSVELRFNQAKQELSNAQNDLQIIQLGTREGGLANTNIKATISGTILEIPVKIGDQVIESNNFNPGTTIAFIANLSNMVFEGKIDEAEVGKLKLDMPLKISLGAINDKEFDAKLRFVAPKGIEDQGAVQFKIEANVHLDTAFFIRAGYSANASLVLDKKENVLAIKEALLQFDKETNSPYVEIETGEQKFERKDVTLGISDGINVEILTGIKPTDKVKVWNITQPEKIESKKGNDFE